MSDNAFIAFLKSSLFIRLIISILIIFDGFMIIKPI